MLLDEADFIAWLVKGEVGAFPTDTLPALAALPQSAHRLWQLKQRPADKPLILMAASLAELLACLGQQPPPDMPMGVARHWPGALTLVLPARGDVAAALNPGGQSLGLRIPNCERSLALLQRSGPLATTSVNLSGKPACKGPEQIQAQFPDLRMLAPLPWPQCSGLASTVVAWQAGAMEPGWRVLRQGSVPFIDGEWH
jgi:L-threonylcarbamoyladenylate synthase